MRQMPGADQPYHSRLVTEAIHPASAGRKVKWHYPDARGVWHVGSIVKDYWFKDDTTGELTFRRPGAEHAIRPRPKKGCPVCTSNGERAQIQMGARYLAKRAIKQRWLAQKIKLSHIDAKDLTQAANEYLEAHRVELLEEARLFIK